MPKPPIQLKRSGTASATPSSLEHGELALNYADSKVFFKNASNTISSFTFQSYALASHTHAASDITSGTLDAARLPLATTIAAGAVIVGTGLGVSSGTVSVTYGTTSGTACQGNDSRLSDARTPTSHSHGNITNAGAIGSTANLPIITTTSGVLTTGSFGTSAATFCEGNDARLSDTRTPTDGSVTTAKIANDAVTYAKLQNVSATDRLLGRSSAGSGDVEEITCGSFGRSLIGSADAAAARSTLSVQPTASPAFTGVVQADVSNDLLDSRGNLRVFTTDTAAIDKGGSIGLGGKNGAGVFDPWAFGVIKGAKENATSGNFSGYLAFGTAGSGGTITERLRIKSTGESEFTGSVVVNNAGNVVPLTVTNTGTANSFVVNDASGDTSPFVIDAAGNVGIGLSSPDASTKLHLGGTYPTSGTVTRAILCNGLVPSGSTVLGDGLVSFIGTVAASFTCANLRHFVVAQGTIGAGSSVTNQFGYVAESSLTGATNNYGFYSDIASGTGRWNFYANGTAANYFAGNVGIGTASPTYKAEVRRTNAYALLCNSDYFSAFFGPREINDGYCTMCYGWSTSGSGNYWQQDFTSAEFSLSLRSGGVDQGISLRFSSGGSVGIGGSPTLSSGVGLHTHGSTLRLGTARTPASSSATGNTGEICWDSSYLYICTATNTWRRIAHSTW